MSLEFFEDIIKQSKQYTNEIACHVFGDPLTLSNLESYLDIIHRYGMKALLTTSGYYLANHTSQTLFHPSVKQINISLNAFNKNSNKMSFESYMESVLALCDEKARVDRDIFINLRIWNLDEQMSEEKYNDMVFEKLHKHFGIEIDTHAIRTDTKSSIRLEYKTLLHFDSYFEWPSMQNPLHGHGTCQGLDSHIAILASGAVVPCCLDSFGIMTLGNLHSISLDEILDSSRATKMREGFTKSICTEELCLHCSYKDRFA